MIDTHAHLNSSDFNDDRDKIIAQAFAAGIDQIVEIADEPGEWTPALKLSRRYPQKIFCSWGVHPHYADQWNESNLIPIQKSPLPQELVAIGEIGIDYAKSRSSPQNQKIVLEQMLDLAALIKLPIVIHVREGISGQAFEDLFAILKSNWRAPITGSRFQGVIHCFSGRLPEAKRALEMGFALGVDGPITYPKNNDLRETVKFAGLDHLVLETDSPYLPPQVIRGKRNDPSQIPAIAESLGQIFSVPIETISQITSQNAIDLFHLVNS